MKILITTPTGRIGRRIVPELLAPEFSVRVIARDPARLPEEVREQVEVVRGSVDDATTLRHALEGVEALFWCVPAESPQETKVERHYERFACAAWQAIREARTPRVVTISARGNGLARESGRVSGLRAMEEILNESGAAIRHLRCGWFMENFLWDLETLLRRGVLCYPMPGDVPLPLVAASDIADVALKWLVRRDWNGIAGVAVHGPQNLSGEEAAAILSGALERSVRYEQVPVEDYVQRLAQAGASAEFGRSLAEMQAELAQDISGAEPCFLESITATKLAVWAESELRPRITKGGNQGCQWKGESHELNGTCCGGDERHGHIPSSHRKPPGTDPQAGLLFYPQAIRQSAHAVEGA